MSKNSQMITPISKLTTDSVKSIEKTPNRMPKYKKKDIKNDAMRAIITGYQEIDLVKQIESKNQTFFINLWKSLQTAFDADKKMSTMFYEKEVQKFKAQRDIQRQKFNMFLNEKLKDSKLCMNSSETTFQKLQKIVILQQQIKDILGYDIFFNEKWKELMCIEALRNVGNVKNLLPFGGGQHGADATTYDFLEAYDKSTNFIRGENDPERGMSRYVAYSGESWFCEIKSGRKKTKKIGEITNSNGGWTFANIGDEKQLAKYANEYDSFVFSIFTKYSSTPAIMFYVTAELAFVLNNWFTYIHNQLKESNLVKRASFSISDILFMLFPFYQGYLFSVPTRKSTRLINKGLTTPHKSPLRLFMRDDKKGALQEIEPMSWQWQTQQRKAAIVKIDARSQWFLKLTRLDDPFKIFKRKIKKFKRGTPKKIVKTAKKSKVTPKASEFLIVKQDGANVIVNTPIPPEYPPVPRKRLSPIASSSTTSAKRQLFPIKN